ncbi:hypothetical protein R1sor_005929 [Riccia sorocarpa]|uniref:Uncharacterized protein n=1 Tax=Riccia sorocarpa TaxID=122646 RepID=A0ABD3HLL3_9MARC
MEHVYYLLEPPWPTTLTFGELQVKHKIPVQYDDTEVCREKGRAGIVPQNWSSEKIDYYLKGVEFVQLEYLDEALSVSPTDVSADTAPKKFTKMKDLARKKNKQEPQNLQEKNPPGANEAGPAKRKRRQDPEQPTAPKRQGIPKQMSVSLTVGQVGADVDANIFDDLAMYLQNTKNVVLAMI